VIFKTAVVGLGAIGLPVARALHRGIPDFTLVGIAANRRAHAERRLAEHGIAVPVTTIDTLVAMADIVVDCAPARAFRAIAEPTLAAGRLLVTVSGAALLEAPELIALAEQHGARIILASGALPGLDAVRAAAEGTIHTVRIVSRKPPLSLRGAPYLDDHPIDLAAIDRPTQIFSGSAREAARAFPANVNVAAALSLAGIGPDRTVAEVWADPMVTRNVHVIEVDADSAHFTMTIEGVPSDENLATGRLTPLSVIAALRSLGNTLRVGS
jgi:aspartate dehydrogenase